MTPLDRAWIALSLLTAVATAAALSPLPSPYSGAIILALSWAKARLIFLHYLELADVPGWRGGILFTLALFTLVLLGLYLAA